MKNKAKYLLEDSTGKVSNLGIQKFFFKRIQKAVSIKEVLGKLNFISFLLFNKTPLRL